MLGLSRGTIYDWLKRFKEHGYAGFDTKKAPGMEPVVTKEMDTWIKRAVLDATPEDFGYDTNLWTCDLLAELLSDRFGVRVIGATINHHLHRMDLTYQKPAYCPHEQDPAAVEQFVNKTFPKLQRFAEKIGADIGFEDETGVDLREHSGKTWGARGIRPEVRVTGKRGRLNIFSVVTAQGQLRYHVTEASITSKNYIQFLKQVIKGRERPLILIVDNASFHHSKLVRTFVCRHRHQIRLHYLPTYSPERKPDEHVWEKLKTNDLVDSQSRTSET